MTWMIITFIGQHADQLVLITLILLVYNRYRRARAAAFYWIDQAKQRGDWEAFGRAQIAWGEMERKDRLSQQEQAARRAAERRRKRARA